MIERKMIINRLIIFLLLFIYSVVGVTASAAQPLFYKNIPLDIRTQKYIIGESLRQNISPELVLAIAHKESNFKKGMIYHNNNGSTDHSMMQLNSRSFSPRNEGHAIQLAIGHLKNLNKYWLSKGYTEETAAILVVQSYHSGIFGTKKLIRRHGYNYQSEYVRDVFDYKYKLENGGIK